MKTEIERQIAETVERVARHFSRAGLPADPADVAQEGYLLALQALGGFNPTRGELGGYLSTILRRSLPKAVTRWRNPFSLSENASRVAGETPLEGASLACVADESLDPEQLVAMAEARARMAAAIAEVVATMGPREGALATADPEERSEDVGARFGVSGGYVRRARRKFAERAAAAPELRELASEAA